MVKSTEVISVIGRTMQSRFPIDCMKNTSGVLENSTVLRVHETKSSLIENNYARKLPHRQTITKHQCLQTAMFTDLWLS